MTKEEALELVRQFAAEMGGVACSSRMPSRVRQFAAEFGGWEEMCKAAGVKSFTQAKREELMAQGVPEKMTWNINRGRSESICVHCKRSLAIAGTQCSLPAQGVPPIGAEYTAKTVYRSVREGEYDIYVVTKCPHFLADDRKRIPNKATTSAYINLANAVIQCAARDYLDENASKYTLAECEAFFRG